MAVTLLGSGPNGGYGLNDPDPDRRGDCTYKGVPQNVLEPGPEGDPAHGFSRAPPPPRVQDDKEKEGVAHGIPIWRWHYRGLISMTGDAQSSLVSSRSGAFQLSKV